MKFMEIKTNIPNFKQNKSAKKQVAVIEQLNEIETIL